MSARSATLTRLPQTLDEVEEFLVRLPVEARFYPLNGRQCPLGQLLSAREVDCVYVNVHEYSELGTGEEIAPMPEDLAQAQLVWVNQSRGDGFISRDMALEGIMEVRRARCN